MNDISLGRRKKEIGRRIAMERKRCGWSQAVFGEKLSEIMNGDDTFGQNTVSYWERGVNLPKSIEVFFAMSQLLACDCGYLLCDYDERTHNSSDICAATGLSEESVNTLCSLKTWDADSNLASVIDALVFDYRYSKKGESFSPLVYLIAWYLQYDGNRRIEKMVHVNGEITDCSDETGYIPSTIKLNSRIIENAALTEIQQALISLKKRLSRKERGKHGKH